MPFAAALSEHPLATHAVGEVVGTVLEQLGDAPDLAVLFVTGPHVGAMEDIAAAVRATLHPTTLIGTTAVSVVGGRREVEHGAAVSLWAARLPAGTVAGAVRLDVVSDGEAVRVVGLPDDLGAADVLLLLADPYTFATGDLLAELRTRRPGLAVVGGLSSAGRGPGGNRIVLDDAITSHGAVGVLLAGAGVPASVVSQGCRPIGEPFTVTRSERNVLYELGGRPALDRLMEIVAALSPDDRALAAKGLHCGVVADEAKLDYQRGDFVVHNVLGADRSVGAVAVGDVVEVGATVQFHVRDAASADEDLRALMEGRVGDGVLLFTCNGRGVHLFGEPDHDAAVVADLLGVEAIGGMFCAGELGPVGGRNHLHGFTASVVVFRDVAGGRPAPSR